MKKIITMALVMFSVNAFALEDIDVSKFIGLKGYTDAETKTGECFLEKNTEDKTLTIRGVTTDSNGVSTPDNHIKKHFKYDDAKLEFIEEDVTSHTITYKYKNRELRDYFCDIDSSLFNRSRVDQKFLVGENFVVIANIYDCSGSEVADAKDGYRFLPKVALNLLIGTKRSGSGLNACIFDLK